MTQDNTRYLESMKTRIHSLEVGRASDQKFWADEIYKLKQRIEKLERHHTMQIDENRKISRRVDELQPKQEKQSFAVGDRVAFYSFDRCTGKIVNIDTPDNTVCVEFMDGKRAIGHPKQCRKLRKKSK